jgi:hypothetical protein
MHNTQNQQHTDRTPKHSYLQHTSSSQLKLKPSKPTIQKQANKEQTPPKGKHEGGLISEIHRKYRKSQQNKLIYA